MSELEQRLVSCIAEMNSLLADVREIQSVHNAKAKRPLAIKKMVAHYYHLTVAELESGARPSSIAWPRMVAMYLTHQTTNQPVVAIAALYHKRDHGTVLHACRRVRDQISIDASFRAEIDEMKKFILGQLSALPEPNPLNPRSRTARPWQAKEVETRLAA